MTEFLGKINFDSKIPYYVQLTELIKNQIAFKVWKPGERIPVEALLCEIYGVSRTVVRQAFDEIENQGLIERRKGKGTFVAAPRISENLAQKLAGFYHDRFANGDFPILQTPCQQVMEANEKIAGCLEIETGAQVIEFSCLHSFKDVAVLLAASYFPLHLCPGLVDIDLTTHSLFDYLETECGLIVTRGRRYIEAVAANEMDARRLNVEPGVPLLQLESISYLENGTPIEFYHARYRGDRSRFEIELARVSETGSSGKISPILEKTMDSAALVEA